jgi:signal transduction histidine kinase
MPVAGLSTGSVYDLLADSKGFIWAAHETGISRFDGVSFKHFSCSQQASLSMTDIVEDLQGKIWCHNFSGQLFHISQDSMHLFAAYDNTKENSYQRILLMNDELLATSAQGLFVCNTATMQSQIITNPTVKASATKSLAVVGQKAVIAGKQWFCYQKGKGLKVLKSDPNLRAEDYRLQPLTTADTAYAFGVYKNGTLCTCKFVIRQDSIILVSKLQNSGRINTITQNDGVIHVNTVTQTLSTDGRVQSSGFDLTDNVTDYEGNHWYSSLREGLLFERHIGNWESVACPEMEENDYIKCLSSSEGNLIYATNKGYVYCKDVKSGQIKAHSKVPSRLGAIQNIFKFCKNILIVVPSIGLLLFDINTGKLKEITSRGTIKRVVATDKSILLAYADSLTSIPITDHTAKVFTNNTEADIELAAANWTQQMKVERCLRPKRCQCLCYDAKEHIVYASFTDGFFGLQQSSFSSLKINKSPVYPISAVQYADKTVINTLQGLYQVNKQSLDRITWLDAFKPGIVTSLKVYKNYLFLTETDALQIFNMQDSTLIGTTPLPGNYSGLIYNIEVLENKLFLATATGLYSVLLSSFSSQNTPAPVNYLLSAVANNKEGALSDSAILEPYQNSIRFTFAAPSYSSPLQTFFLYQLKGGNDTSWHKLKEAEFLLSLASLKPGNYTLNAYAVNYKHQKARWPLQFRFVIKKPWWQQTWFNAFVFLSTILLTYLIVWWRFRRLRIKSKAKELQQQQLEREILQKQLAIQEQEQQRIAEDLHDDVGATLSALLLHLSSLPGKALQDETLAKKFYNQALYLSSKAANDVRSISHNLLPKDFSSENLFNILKSRIQEMNQPQHTFFYLITDGNPLKLKDILAVAVYRIINELINNVAKHAQASEATIQLLIYEENLQIISEDNGIGISQSSNNIKGIGMQNIASRVRYWRGIISIDSNTNGTSIIISIPFKIANE